jgi:hypothetical protein
MGYLQALIACAEYDKSRKTVGSKILFFHVEILYAAWVAGKIE